MGTFGIVSTIVVVDLVGEQMRYISMTVCILVLLAGPASAQDKPSVTLGLGRREIRLALNPVEPLSPGQIVTLSDINNYRLYEIENADDPATMRGVDKTSDLLVPAAPFCEFGCTRIALRLKRALEYDHSYALKILGFVFDGKPFSPIRIEVKANAEILASVNASNTRKQIRVLSQVPIRPTDTTGSSVLVEEKTLKIVPGSAKVKQELTQIRSTLTEGGSSSVNDLTLTLHKKLTEGQAHNLVVREGANGISEAPVVAAAPAATQAVLAKGVVKIPGLASAPDAPKIDLKFSTNAAVHQKPAFDLVTNLAPLGAVPVGSAWFWEPKLSVDVGLGTSKSSNSIILNIPFRKNFSVSDLTEISQEEIDNVVVAKGETLIPTYWGWTRTPWYSMGSVNLFLSPLKLETDRKFQRVNILGNVRAEFNFHRWLATIKDKRKYLEDLQDLANLVEVNDGFRIVPYISVDFGKHANKETVENTKKKVSLIVPSHNIFRTYFGVSSIFQWRLLEIPMSLTIDESLVYLATRETIGYVTDAGVGQRQLRGLHHRGKASWDIFLDPAKHYTLNFSYENGRLAPNFEYLNKVSTGLRIIY